MLMLMLLLLKWDPNLSRQLSNKLARVQISEKKNQTSNIFYSNNKPTNSVLQMKIQTLRNMTLRQSSILPGKNFDKTVSNNTIVLNIQGKCWALIQTNVDVQRIHESH